MGRYCSFLIFVAALCATACNQGRYFAFEDVEYVKDFPVSYHVDSMEPLPIDVMGIQGISVFDDLILLSCSDTCGCLSAFSKDGKPVSKPFLHIGRGPGEVLFQPYMSWFSFSENREQKKGGLYDFKGNYLEYDIYESLSKSCISYECLADSLSIFSGARYFKVADTLLICRRINDENDGFGRFLLDFRGNEISNDAMSYLNSVRSAEKNLLSTLFVSNMEEGIVAELGSRLNVIHLYSLYDDFCRTVSVGGKLENIEKIEEREEGDMRKIYYEAKAFRDFFVGLYLGATFNDLDNGTYSPPELHFFKWDGTPVASISLPVRALFFDVDFQSKLLYVVDSETEKVLMCDISFLDSKLTQK